MTLCSANVTANGTGLYHLVEPGDLSNFISATPSPRVTNKVIGSHHPLHLAANKLGLAHPVSKQDTFDGLSDGRH